MAGVCYDKISCETCGSSDGKQVFVQEDGTYDATCFACGEFDRDPYNGNPAPEIEIKAPANRQEQVDRITADYPIRAIEHRGLRKEVCEYLGIRVAVSQVDGKTITQHFYPSELDGNILGYEVRCVEPKRFYAIGNRRDIDFFGWRQALDAGGKKLYIVEDALSCASLIQAIKDYSSKTAWADRWPAVVALPKGADSAAMMIDRHRKDLASWQEIVLILDDDVAGRKAEDTIITMLGGSTNVTVAKLTLKDPNDMVMQGRSVALATTALFRSKPKRYDGVKDVTDYIENAITPPAEGISWPWPSATKGTFGIRVGEVHIVGAAPKIGKTDHQHQLATHLITHHGLTVGLFDLENAGAKTLRRLAGKTAQKAFHRPDVYVKEGEIEEACMKLDGKVKFYDSSNDRSWESVKGAIISMNKVDGVQHFFIDPLTALISMMDSSNANDALNLIMTEIAELGQKLPATFFLYSHVNPPPRSAKPHEQGGRVLSSQFTGSRAMEKWANYGWGIERNRDAETEEERNTATVRLLFDREYGVSCNFPVVYNPTTNTFLEGANIDEDF